MALAGASAWGAGPKDGGARMGGETRADISARYQRELAACRNGTSTHQDVATCLHDVRAAHAEQVRGTLPDGAAVDPENAMRRCEALKGSDRLACRDRMQGKGTVSGSVAGGGVLRELVTVETVPAGTVATPGPAASQPAR